MTDTQEAIARIRIAEFETCQEAQKKQRRCRLWRRALVLVSIAVPVAASWYVFRPGGWRISAELVFQVSLLNLAYLAWASYKAEESIRSLQAEVQRLKDQLDEQSR